MYAYKLPNPQLPIPTNGIFVQHSASNIRSRNWLQINLDNQDQIEYTCIYRTHRLTTPQQSIILDVDANLGFNPFAVLLRDFALNSITIGYNIINAAAYIPKEEIPMVRAIVEHNLSLCPTDLYTLITLQKYRKQLKLTLKRLNQLTNIPWQIVRADDAEWVLPKHVAFFSPILLANRILNMDRQLLAQQRVEQVPLQIQPYATRAETHFKVKTNTNAPLIGIELELEPKIGKTRDQALHYSYGFLENHCIFKSDGSVAAGFEVVSKPALWKDQLKEWGPWFDKLSDYMTAKSNCGMHIHMNRRSLSFLQLAKLVEFINREENIKYLIHVAGRQPNHYCVLQKDNNISAVGRHLNNNVEIFGSRHVGLNLTNKNTIEFRMFAATTDLDVFQKNIEFVVALRDYFTPGNSTLHPKEQTHFTKFLEWIKQPSNKKMYSKLHQHNLAFNPA